MEEELMESRKIERVEDMPVYQEFFALAVDVEKRTRDCGADFRWLRVQALRQLANLTSSIERKIQQRGKAKPVPASLKESESDYDCSARR